MTSRTPFGHRNLAEFFAALRTSRVATSATAIVATRGDTVFESSFDLVDASGYLGAEGEARYDLASLTKPCAATLAIVLDETNELPLNLAVGEIWHAADEPVKSTRLEDLLRHSGGFQPWAPVYHLCQSRHEAERLLLGSSLLGAQSGTYSDLGYMLWGLSAEHATGRGLVELFAKSLSKLSSGQGIGGGSSEDTRVRTCLLDTDVEQRLAGDLGLTIDLLGAPRRGEVQDGNARFLGGLAAHAGLFGSARDLLDLARAWLDPSRSPSAAGPARALSGEGAYGLGWARRDTSASAGDELSPNAFGHTGFTGSSLWIDPSSDRIFVLAAHRATTAADLAPWRRAFHALGQRE